MLDLKAESSGLGEDELERRKYFLAELWEKVVMKESMLAQKARARWLREGDDNSGFFHACINSRRRVNLIQALQSRTGWLVEVEDVKQEILDHFTSQFSDNCWDTPLLDGVLFN